MRWACLGLWALVGLCSGGRVLIGPPSVSPSHKLALLPLADGLAARGHDVLVWEVMTQAAKYPPKLARQDSRLIRSTGEWAKDPESDPAFQYFIWDGPFDRFFEESLVAYIASFSCQEYLQTESEHFQRLVDTPWDVMVFDELFNPCSYALAGLLRARHGTAIVLYVSNVRLTITSAAYNRAPLNPAFSPPFGSIFGFSDRMSFLQRAYSTFMATIRFACVDASLFLQDWKLGSLLPTPRPELKAGLLNPDLLISAYLQEMQFPVSQPGNVVALGGIHLPQDSSAEKDLPAEWASILGGYRGFLIVGVGHMAKWAFAPPRIVDAFIGGFESLPPDVLVIFQCKDGFPAERLPPNVHVASWLPQRALLAHPKCLGFVSHGGANSVAEAAVNGVPMIVIPLFADQPDAAALVQASGLGIRLSKFSLDVPAMSGALKGLLEDPKYRARSQKFAQMLGPEPQKAALHRGIFHVERLIRRHNSTTRGFGSRARVTAYGWAATAQRLGLDIIFPSFAIGGLVLFLGLQGAALLLGSAKN